MSSLEEPRLIGEPVTRSDGTKLEVWGWGRRRIRYIEIRFSGLIAYFSAEELKELGGGLTEEDVHKGINRAVQTYYRASDNQLGYGERLLNLDD